MTQLGNYILDSVRGYLSNEIDTDAFRVAFAGAYHYARSSAAGDREANLLANALIGPFAEFAGGHRSEESLRAELAAAIVPFLWAAGSAAAPTLRSRSGSSQSAVSVSSSDAHWSILAGAGSSFQECSLSLA